MEKRKSKNPIVNLFGYTWKYSFGAKRRVVFFVMLSVIANVIYLMQPIVAGKIFNAIQLSETVIRICWEKYSNIWDCSSSSRSDFWLFLRTSRVIENSNAFLVRKNYKKEMFDKVMDLPVAWHKDHHSGDTIGQDRQGQ